VEIRQFRPKLKLLSVLSIAVLAVLAVMTIWLNHAAAGAVHQKNAEQFEWDSRQITHIVQGSLNGYGNTLYSGRAFVLNSQVVTPAEWTGFYKNQDIFNRLKGLNSVSYVQVVSAAQVDQFVALRRAQPEIGPNYVVTPVGDRPVYALGALTVSRGDNLKPNGFDVYSTPDRRAVYQLAQDTGQPAASGITTFTDGTKGIFMTLAVNRQAATVGYVVAAVHDSDFFNAVVDESTLGVIDAKVIDVTNEYKPNTMYVTAGWSDHNKGLSTIDTVTFAGRKWKIEYQAPANYTHNFIAVALPYLILFTGLILILGLMLVFYIFFKTVPISKLGSKDGPSHISAKSKAKSDDPRHITVTTNVDLDS
jgi:CHASE1-domain containing sensor protein